MSIDDFSLLRFIARLHDLLDVAAEGVKDMVALENKDIEAKFIATLCQKGSLRQTCRMLGVGPCGLSDTPRL